MDTQPVVKHADDGTFDDLVLKSGKPTLVDFWAPWCGPCKAIGPVLEEISRDYGEKVNVVKVNVDESPKTALKYMVRSIPTLVFIKDGQVKDTRIGSMSKATLTALIDKTFG